MRSRIIRPGFWENEDLPGVTHAARLLFIGLWQLADREGRLEDRPIKIKIRLFPMEPEIDVNEHLEELEAINVIVRYTVKGSKYIQVVNFTKHQPIHVKESASTIPAPNSHLLDRPSSTSTSTSTYPPSKPPPSRAKAKKGKRGKVGRGRFKPPTVEEVRAFCREKEITLVDPEVFVTHYQARGWYAGKSRMRDWQAAVWNWNTRAKAEGPTHSNAGGRWGEQDWLRKGQELDMYPRPGETMQQFIHRVRAKLETPGIAHTAADPAPGKGGKHKQAGERG